MIKRISLLSGSVFLVGILLFLVRSISIPDLFCDEVSYITQAYSLSLGKVLFKETTLMHMGAVALAPFVWFYWHLCGSTEGLWLFSRFIFIAFNFLVGFFIYRVFRRQYPKGFLFGAALCCVLYVSSIPVLYYDTVGDFGLILGTLCFLQLWQKQGESTSRLIVPLLGAGLMFSLMTFAYPSMVILVAYFGCMLLLKSVFDVEFSKRWRMFSLYLCGGLIAIAGFMIYVQQNIGFTNLIDTLVQLVSSSLGQEILWSSNAPPQFSFFRLIAFANITVACLGYLGLATILCFSLIVIGCYVSRRPIHWPPILLISLALSPFLTTFLKEPRLPGIVATYYSFWAVPMFILTRNKKKLTWLVFSLLLIPDLITHVVYGMTATGPGRFIQGHYSGILAFLLIAPNFCNQYSEDETPTRSHPRMWAFFTAVISLSLAYSYFMRASFSYTSFPELFTEGRMIEKGVLHGMFVQQKHASYAEAIEDLAQRYSSSSNIVFWGDYHKYGYLCQPQRPCIVNEWAPTVSIRQDGIRALLSRLAYEDHLSYDNVSTFWKGTLETFQKHQIKPDVLIVHPKEIQAEDAQQFLSLYEEVIQSTNHVVMRIKPSNPQ